MNPVPFGSENAVDHFPVSFKNSFPLDFIVFSAVGSEVGRFAEILKSCNMFRFPEKGCHFLSRHTAENGDLFPGRFQEFRGDQTVCIFSKQNHFFLQTHCVDLKTKRCSTHAFAADKILSVFM